MIDNKVRVKLYTHRGKEANWELGEKIGLSEEAIKEQFKWCCDEVEVDIELDMTTGEYVVIGCDGKYLEGVERTEGIPEYDEAKIVT